MFIEQNCTVEHEGKAFESGGSAYNGQCAVAYMSKDLKRVTTWHGEDLGPARVISAWETPRSWVSSYRYQVEATIDGVRYTGRTCGAGMVWFGKRKAGL